MEEVDADTRAQSEVEMEKLLASEDTAPRQERPTRDTYVAGILRLDLSKPRRSSGSSVEFRIPSPSIQPCDSPASPQPSVGPWFEPTSNMDKVRFEPEPDQVLSDDEEEEEYSQSVSAIFQRKASTRASRKRRRSSSPMFTQDTDDNLSSLRNRRRSSVFTTSSGDTAISVEDAVQEQILQNIKLHKEVLSSVKQQPWNMRRKLRLVRQAQAYIRRHEGELQERLAQGRTTRDVLARFNIVINKHWQHTKRELANLMNVLIPWEIRIKEIESHFGSVVASYFTFLRWLFWVNLVTAVVLIVFVTVPEMLMANTKKAGMRKNMLDDEVANATNLFTLWDFDGVLKYSPLFYGYYSHQDPEDKTLAKSIGYKMPLAYFITELVVYVYSFVAILRRMAENSRQSKLSEKDDECVFTWKLFTGWDYMIGNAETAHNRTASIILGFKEALLEEAEKKRDEGRNWKVTSLRIFAHLNVVWLLGSSVYAVILVVERSTQPEAEHGWWRKNEITIVITLITSLFPVFFEALGIVEQYHPRKKLRMQLARIMALNLLNLYTLIFASFSKINEMSNILQSLRPNNSAPLISPLPTAAHQIGEAFTESSLTIPAMRWTTRLTPDTMLACRNISVPCPSTQTLGVATMILSLISNTTPVLLVPFSGMTMTELSTSSMSTVTPPETLNLNDENTSSYTLNSFVTFEVEDNQIYEDYDVVDDKLYQRLLQGTENSSTENYEDTTTSNEGEKNITLFEESFNNNTTNSYNSNEFNATENETLPEEFVSTFSSPQSFTHGSQSSPTAESSSVEMCEETVCESIIPSVQTEATTFTHSTGAYVTTTLKPPSLAEVENPQYTDLTSYIDTLDQETLKKLRPLCWETMFGREMVKLTVMDLVMTVVSTLMVDFFRAVFVRYMNNCWCWDLEKKFPQYGDFKMAENILHLVNNQGMVWMGMFFSPGLPLINIIKLAIMMYLRSWAVLTCNVPHEVVFRASSSNNFYLALLLTMLFLCVLPVGYAVVWVVPSWHCGPFSNYYRIYYIFTQSLKKALPYKSLHKAFDYIASPGIVIPLLILLVLIIYYLISLTTSLREANNDLKIQLRRERTEERRKMFQLVDKKRQEAENPIFKWKKAMPNFSRGKMSIADIPIDLLKSSSLINGAAKYDAKHKDLIDEFVKKTKRIPSGTSEEENGLLDGGEGTDVEQHDSLPLDTSRNLQDVELHGKKEKIVKKILNEKKKIKKDNRKRSTHAKRLDNRDREDSGWSEIPEIRIIQTESAERLDDVENEESENQALNDNEVKSLDVTKKKPNKGHTPVSSKETHNKSSKKNDESASQSKETGKENHDKHSKSENKKKLESNSASKESNQSKHEDEGKEDREKRSTHETKADRELKLKSKIQSGMLKTKALKGLEYVRQIEGECESDNIKESKSKSKTRKKTVENKDNSKQSKGSADNEENKLETSANEETSEDDVDQAQEEDNSDEEEIKSEQNMSKSRSDESKNRDKTSDQNRDASIKHTRNETDSEDSEASSQNTVKKIDIKEEKKEGEKADKPSSSKQKSSADKSKKSSARLRIASVLLKEAKRRSSTGHDEN